MAGVHVNGGKVMSCLCGRSHVSGNVVIGGIVESDNVSSVVYM